MNVRMRGDWGGLIFLWDKERKSLQKQKDKIMAGSREIATGLWFGIIKRFEELHLGTIHC